MSQEDLTPYFIVYGAKVDDDSNMKVVSEVFRFTSRELAQNQFNIMVPEMEADGEYTYDYIYWDSMTYEDGEWCQDCEECESAWQNPKPSILSPIACSSLTVCGRTRGDEKKWQEKYKKYVMLGAAHEGDTRSYEEIINSCPKPSLFNKEWGRK